MIRKPTSGDSEQRDRDSERARKSSELSAGGAVVKKPVATEQKESACPTKPMHGSSEGESAHGAIPRKGIEVEQGDD